MDKWTENGGSHLRGQTLREQDQGGRSSSETLPERATPLRLPSLRQPQDRLSRNIVSHSSQQRRRKWPRRPGVPANRNASATEFYTGHPVGASAAPATASVQAELKVLGKETRLRSAQPFTFLARKVGDAPDDTGDTSKPPLCAGQSRGLGARTIHLHHHELYTLDRGIHARASGTASHPSPYLPAPARTPVCSKPPKPLPSLLRPPQSAAATGQHHVNIHKANTHQREASAWAPSPLFPLSPGSAPTSPRSPGDGPRRAHTVATVNVI